VHQLCITLKVQYYLLFPPTGIYPVALAWLTGLINPDKKCSVINREACFMQHQTFHEIIQCNLPSKLRDNGQMLLNDNHGLVFQYM
jgi:hypothetical protein